MTAPSKRVLVVSDGSSLSNQTRDRKAGAAAVLEYQGKRKVVGEFLGTATNQRAEVTAACIGLEALREPCEVTLVSDSEYVIRTMLGEYRRRSNLDLWERLDRAARRHRVIWTWTRGHAGHELQELCDRAARLIAKAGRVDQAALEEIIAASP
ncbi:MAG: ribonuclease HI [Acidobacteria bacterium]|nr:ribonuclease HI [Acidobacteriota bacterium]